MNIPNTKMPLCPKCGSDQVAVERSMKFLHTRARCTKCGYSDNIEKFTQPALKLDPLDKLNLSIVLTKHINNGDCWALTLSRALNLKYDDVFNHFKSTLNGINSNGSVNFEDVFHYLSRTNFRFVDLTSMMHSQPKVYQVMEVLKEYPLIISSLDPRKEIGHLSYAYKGKHFTTTENTESFNDSVLHVWILVKNLI